MPAADPTATFDRIAERYDLYAALPAQIGERLLERLDGLNFSPESILDLGCGTGLQAQRLRQQRPDARVIALDASASMLAQAGKRQGWWRRRFERVCARAEALPLGDASFDLVHANLVLGWCPDWPAVLGQLRRVLRPGGMLLVSTLGLDTLTELRQTPLADQLLPYGLTDVQRLGSALTQAGFSEPVLDTDWLTASYSGAETLARELRAIGYLDSSEPAGDIADPDGFRAGGQEVTWEVVYATAWAPDEGQPIRTDRGEEASVSISSLKVRRR